MAAPADYIYGRDSSDEAQIIIIQLCVFQLMEAEGGGRMLEIVWLTEVFKEESSICVSTDTHVNRKPACNGIPPACKGIPPACNGIPPECNGICACVQRLWQSWFRPTVNL